MEQTLVATRDRNGDLHLFVVKDPTDVIKNNGTGHWIPKFNTGTKQIDLNPDEFPEISWDDMSPTPLKLVNMQSEESVENISLTGTIEIRAKSSFSNDNINTGSVRTLFISDISSIEGAGPNKCLIHMRNGDVIECEQGERTVKHLISKA